MPAREKLQSEMTQNNINPMIQAIGGFLLGHLDANPDSAERILTTDKTIAKSLDEMRKAAEKKKIGNCAVLTDQEGFTIVLKYFGIKSTAPATAQVSSPGVISSSTPQAYATKSEIDFDIKLEDLL